MLFSGVGVALITPFLADGSIDYVGLDAAIEHVISGGVDYIVSLGTTGESATLSEAEQHDLLVATRKAINARVKWVVGIGGNNTAAVVDKLTTCNLDGVDGILSVSPYYNKPTQAGIYAHYKAVSLATVKPIILYNVPSRTQSNITADTTIRLAQDCPNIVGIKEASGDFQQISEIISKAPKDFEVISGDDALTLPLMAIGVCGVISVIANAYPKEYSAMVAACSHQDFVTARQLNQKFLELYVLLFEQGNPAGVKSAMQSDQLIQDFVRLPLTQVDKQLAECIRQAKLNW